MTTAIIKTDTRSAILETGQKIMGRKGFSAVGLNELLSEAGVPKGSFYHYFKSKEAFGEALLSTYFDDYLADMDTLFAKPGLTMAERLMTYFAYWRETQGALDCQGRCLAVKLAAEVADLSEAMRLALKKGTAGIISRLCRAIEAGIAEGSLTIAGSARDTAAALYHQWLGASIMAKILRTHEPFEMALASTRMTLGLSAVKGAR